MRGPLVLGCASALLLAALPMGCAGGDDSSTTFVQPDGAVDATADVSPGMDATRDARADGAAMTDGTAMDVADTTTPPVEGGGDASDAASAGDALMDAADAGTDAGTDAVAEAAPDAAPDTATEAATDASTDAAADVADAGSCSESPCKLVSPQCGCPPGAECAVNPMGRFCTVAGSVGAGAVCSAAMPCAPGLGCVLLSPTVSTCNVFCSADSQCTAPGGLCIVTLSNGMGGSIPNVTLCTDNCDPFTSTGCVAGLSCQVGQEMAGQMRFFTQCTGAGAGSQGAACMTSANCAPDFACVNSGASSVCLRYCDVNAPACPGVLTCFQLVGAGMTPIVIGGTSIGVCQ